jgi:hypothetical protein
MEAKAAGALRLLHTIRYISESVSYLQHNSTYCIYEYLHIHIYTLYVHTQQVFSKSSVIPTNRELHMYSLRTVWLLSNNETIPTEFNMSFLKIIFR